MGSLLLSDQNLPLHRRGQRPLYLAHRAQVALRQIRMEREPESAQIPIPILRRRRFRRDRRHGVLQGAPQIQAAEAHLSRQRAHRRGEGAGGGRQQGQAAEQGHHQGVKLNAGIDNNDRQKRQQSATINSNGQQASDLLSGLNIARNEVEERAPTDQDNFATAIIIIVFFALFSCLYLKSNLFVWQNACLLKKK